MVGWGPPVRTSTACKVHGNSRFVFRVEPDLGMGELVGLERDLSLCPDSGFLIFRRVAFDSNGCDKRFPLQQEFVPAFGSPDDPHGLGSLKWQALEPVAPGVKDLQFCPHLAKIGNEDPLFSGNPVLDGHFSRGNKFDESGCFTRSVLNFHDSEVRCIEVRDGENPAVSEQHWPELVGCVPDERFRSPIVVKREEIEVGECCVSVVECENADVVLARDEVESEVFGVIAAKDFAVFAEFRT